MTLIVAFVVAFLVFSWVSTSGVGGDHCRTCKGSGRVKDKIKHRNTRTGETWYSRDKAVCEVCEGTKVEP